MQLLKSQGMAHFGKILRKLIAERHMDNETFAKEAGIGTDTLYRNLRSAVPSGRFSTYVTMADALGLSPGELDAKWKGVPASEEEPTPSNFKIRMVSDVAAGDFNTQFDVNLMAEEGVPGALYPEPLQDPMLLAVVGSSMVSDGPESIEEGDLVLFGNALEEEIPDGEIVVARHLVRKTHQVKILKRLAGGRVQLQPANPKFKPIEVNAEDVDLRRVLIVIRRRYLRNRR